MAVENLTVEGEPVKRYRVNYGGEHVAEGDTAQEAWDRYRDYEDKIRPVTDKGKRYRYLAVAPACVFPNASLCVMD